MVIYMLIYYQIDEIYIIGMDYDYIIEDQNNFGSVSLLEGSFNYSLCMFWCFFVGVGIIFGKLGFLIGEIEYVNYGGNKFLFEGFFMVEVEINQEIRDNLFDVIWIWMGVEYVIEDFCLCGGVGL